jgi:exopolysaccharide biosynthesis polyprenyl glycosylphosphotransferase
MEKAGPISADQPPREGVGGGRDLPDDLSGFWGKKLVLRIWGGRGSLLFLLDLLGFIASIIVAYYGRYHVDGIMTWIPPTDPTPPTLIPFLKAATLLACSWLFLLARSGAYRSAPQLVRSLGWQIRELVHSGFYAFGLLMMFGGLYHGLLVSRVVYLLAFIMAMLTALGTRLLFAWLENSLAGQGVLKEKVVVIGGGRRVTEFLHHLQSQNPSVIVAGRLLAKGNSDPAQVDRELPILGGVREIAAVFQRWPFDSLLFIPEENGDSQGYLDRELMMVAVNFCESRHIPFYMVPDALGVAVASREVSVCRDYPVIELRDASLHFGYKIVKRLMDIVISLVVLVVGLPLWLLIALLIRLTSAGPVIYIQERVGREGQPFKMYKFRSMVADADARLPEMIDFASLPEPVFNIKHDPRVTPIGKILRRTSLDEIPQFFNVLWGNMSLVGPRPERVELVAQYNLWQRRRLKAKPGITGYQQIMSRGHPSLEKRIAYDLYYLKHQGLWLDLFILVQTLIVVIRGDGLN